MKGRHHKLLGGEMGLEEKWLSLLHHHNQQHWRGHQSKVCLFSYGELFTHYPSHHSNICIFLPIIKEGDLGGGILRLIGEEEMGEIVGVGGVMGMITHRLVG